MVRKSMTWIYQLMFLQVCESKKPFIIYDIDLSKRLTLCVTVAEHGVGKRHNT